MHLFFSSHRARADSLRFALEGSHSRISSEMDLCEFELADLTDEQLLVAIPLALDRWTSVLSTRRKSLAARKDWQDYTDELERRYPLAPEE